MRKEGKKEKSRLLDPDLEILLSAHARASQADILHVGSEGREMYDLLTAL